jgi:carboxypeptidase C (cathepsin A)
VHTTKRLLATLTTVALLAAAPSHNEKKEHVVIPPVTPDAVTHHINHVNGQTIRYAARAGTITLRNDDNQITARMFYVAYTKDGADPNKRPVTFFYNGGPGSSTVWLRMASYGPVRVAVTNGAATPPAPYDLVDNHDSLLDKTDEVFIDAPNTGYSRVIGYGKPADFMGIDQDGRAFTQFIERYLTQFNRWNSPKFLFGESYGTTRDAVLSDMLQRANVQINGVVFQSSILNFGLTGLGGFDPIGGGDWAYVLYLPSEAATAWYHHRVPGQRGSLASFLDTVENFAGNEYLQALERGDALDPATRADVVRKLHDYLGLSESYISNAQMRIPYYTFEKQLMRDRDIVLGRYDARYALYGVDRMGDFPQYDPSDVGMNSAVVSTWNAYVRNQLHYDTNLEYRPTSYGPVLGARWDMHHNGQEPPPNVVPDLAEAMSQNPHLQVFSANGYYDFATPFFATYYTLQHMDIAPPLQKNITFGYYQSGHMIYLSPTARVAYQHDLDRWYDRTLSASR